MTGRTVRVAVDAMGADRGPAEIVAGAREAASPELQPIVVGPAGLDTQGLELVEAPDVIGMDEKPTDAVRSKPESSLVVACRIVGEGRADAVVSPGNTGAMLAGSLRHLGRVQGVRRPAIAVAVPSGQGPSVLLDAGANADARPEDLVQFAVMGLVFAEEILEIAEPRVRLLSIGEEPEKGNQLALEAHDLLVASGLNFAGNTEGRDMLSGGGDVIVTDGFTGNVALKLLEGTIKNLLEALRAEVTSTTRGRIGGLLTRPAVQRLRRRLDPDTYGGAYLLGLRHLAVVAHGNSSSRAICNAVRLAARGVEHDVVGRLAERMLESARFQAPTTG